MVKRNEKDTEIAAMASVVEALEELSQESRGRVLSYAASRYSTDLSGAKGNGGSASDASIPEDQDFPTLISTGQPATDADRALLGGYFLQVVKSADDFPSQEVNKELKHVGEGVKNITDAFNTLMARKPAQVMQTQKSGKAKQARKRYKLTAPGLRRAKDMLSSADDE